MKNFGYDIYLSKNIEKEEVEKLIAENYPERQFIYTSFMGKPVDTIAERTEEYAYFYIHQQQDILNSQFPFCLQIEGLPDEPNRWQKAYTLVEKICTFFKIYCFIEYPLNTENPSPYNVLLYMPDGEIHLASDADYTENGVIYPISIFKDSTIKKSPAMQLKTIGELIKTPDWSSDNDWVSAKEIPIPFFENKAFTVRFEAALSTEDYFEKAEEALQSFFYYSDDVKAEAAQKVYNNWIEFNEACSFLDNLEMFEAVDDPSDWMLNDIKKLKHLSSLKSPDKVWEYISPIEIVVTKDRFNLDKEIYIQVLCKCVWEDEHGIQFVFKQGKELIRVSGQDGDLFD